MLKSRELEKSSFKFVSSEVLACYKKLLKILMIQFYFDYSFDVTLKLVENDNFKLKLNIHL